MGRKKSISGGAKGTLEALKVGDLIEVTYLDDAFETDDSTFDFIIRDIMPTTRWGLVMGKEEGGLIVASQILHRESPEGISLVVHTRTIMKLKVLGRWKDSKIQSFRREAER